LYANVVAVVVVVLLEVQTLPAGHRAGRRVG